ncbi:MAG: hypothetical protein JSR91_04725 [Proteobacteria bacterium]|nr:hypothetical protein [Pseudomonadota bacterium]
MASSCRRERDAPPAASACIMAEARPGEVPVSRVVTDLVAGTGLGFAGRGGHELEGLLPEDLGGVAGRLEGRKNGTLIAATL